LFDSKAGIFGAEREIRSTKFEIRNSKFSDFGLARSEEEINRTLEIGRDIFKNR